MQRRVAQLVPPVHQPPHLLTHRRRRSAAVQQRLQTGGVALPLHPVRSHLEDQMEDCLARVGLHHAERAAVRLEDAQRAGMAIEGGLERAGGGRRAGRIQAQVEEDFEMLVKTLGAGQLQDGVEIGGTGAEGAYVGPELSQLGGVVRAVWFCLLQQGTQAVLKKG